MHEKKLGREREIQPHFLNMKKKTTEVTFLELIHKANKSKCRMNKNRDLTKGQSHSHQGIFPTRMNGSYMPTLIYHHLQWIAVDTPS